MADGAEHGVGLVAMAALEVIAAEMAVALQMSNHRLDGRAAFQFAFDGAEDTALLSGDEDPERLGRVVAAIALVGISPLDLAACEISRPVRAWVSSSTPASVWPLTCSPFFGPRQAGKFQLC